MAEINRSGKKIILECDCGAVHKISKDENDELQITSTYKKPKKEELNESTGKEKERTPSIKSDDLF